LRCKGLKSHLWVARDCGSIRTRPSLQHWRRRILAAVLVPVSWHVAAVRGAAANERSNAQLPRIVLTDLSQTEEVGAHSAALVEYSTAFEAAEGRLPLD
jgi:hypothetical protein